MKRANRLRRPEQFRRVRRDGRTFTTPLLTLTVLAGRRHRIRCGFVSGKRLGGAVQRNRARRRVREAVRLFLPAIIPGYDLVFYLHSPDLLSTPFATLQQTVEDVLRRAQIWRLQSTTGTLPAPSSPCV